LRRELLLAEREHSLADDPIPPAPLSFWKEREKGEMMMESKRDEDIRRRRPSREEIIENFQAFRRGLKTWAKKGS
jgi:hypothetical protein